MAIIRCVGNHFYSKLCNKISEQKEIIFKNDKVEKNKYIFTDIKLIGIIILLLIIFYIVYRCYKNSKCIATKINEQLNK